MSKKKKYTIYSDEIMHNDEESSREAKPVEHIKWRLRMEKKGRGGKMVTIVDDGLQATEDQVNALAKELKRHCGVGGSVKEEGIVLQGDVRQKVIGYLRSKGFRDIK